MPQWITMSLVFLLLGVLVICEGHYSEADGRFYFPEFQERARRAHDLQRLQLVSKALTEAAGVYKDKSRSAQLGLQQSVFITVVSYTDQARYKALLHNFLCFTEHYGIDLVVYAVQHNIKDWEEEQRSYAKAGIRMLPYPDELFWTLMYTKSSEVLTGGGKADYQSAVPSFASHGALVMLVPVLEVLLRGYNCIFFDVDIALVLDPVPFLTRGQSDFVTSIESRSCLEAYAPTRLNLTAPAAAPLLHRQHHTPAPRPVPDSIDWYAVEPNSGIMSVRATEAGIGFYTKWLLRVISQNDMNDQKSFLPEPQSALHSSDCMYADLHHGHARQDQKTTRSRSKAPQRPRFTSLKERVEAQRSAQRRGTWAQNYTTLVNDVRFDRFQQPARFCFLSEILFQNGQTAFTCAEKQVFKESWTLEMARHGLHGPAETGVVFRNESRYASRHAAHARFVVTLHANYCNAKDERLAAHGVWLLKNTTTADSAFTADMCRAYDPYETYYATRNWAEEARVITNKRNYIYETQVQPGKFVQSIHGHQVYLINALRQRQLIPDDDTFNAKFGEQRRAEVRFLPRGIVDAIPLGEPIRLTVL